MAVSKELFSREVPLWLRRPADVTPPKGAEELRDRINEFFEECAETATRPTVTGLALATGLPGPTSLLRLGQRLPQLRYIISRALAAVAYGYEEMLAEGVGGAGAQFMLKNLPDFDPDEPSGSAPVQFFNDRKEIFLSGHIHGAASEEDQASDLDAIEAYVEMMKKRGQVVAQEKRSEEQLITESPVRKNYVLKIIGPAKK
jgi:hypothetical protein